jgi:hypothetical protein
MTNISEMVGKTFQKVLQRDIYEDELVFENENEKFIFYHDQTCCESVDIEDITGDLSDLENTPILVAEERSGESGDVENGYDVYEWTFYEFRTIKGSVTVRWYGTSNGYYSTSVDLRKEVK